MRIINADLYLKSIKPKGISEEMWTESEAYKSIMRMPLVDAVPVEWIEKKIEWLKSTDNAFASLTASNIQAMLNSWEEEQHGETDKR